MTSPVPPSLERFGDELHQAVGRELRDGAPSPGDRGPRLRRPRMLAGSALGLAGLGAALALALGGATAAPALAVTHESNGSVLVTVNLSETNAPWVEGADDRLASMGINEQILIAASPANNPEPTSGGPVSCAPVTGPSAPTGPPIQVQFTGRVPAGNTGAGAAGASGCGYMATPAAGSGNTGAAG